MTMLTLLPHQRKGVDFMVARERGGCKPAGGLLADDPGLGKTIMTIGLMLADNDDKPSKATLILCPKAVQQQWMAEIGRFAPTLREATVLLSFNKQPPPDAAGGCGWRVGIMSYSTLSHHQRNPMVAALMDRSLHRIVFDEGHVLRNPASKAHQAAARLRATHRWVLSGTPLVNKPQDVWALLQILHCPSALRHRQAPACLASIRQALRPLMLRRTAHDIRPGSLPQLVTKIEHIGFDSQQEAELYARVEAHCKHRAWLGLRTGNDALVMEALTRCRQMAIHPQLVIRGLSRKRHGDELTKHLPSAWPFYSTKLRIVTELVAALQASEKVLVLCSFLEEMQLIAASLEDASGISVLQYHGRLRSREREAVVATFQAEGAGSARVMLVQVQAGGTGLNLQAASRVVISSMPWTPAAESQGIHRACRLGQKNSIVSVHKIVLQGTIDERILNAQATKNQAADKLLLLL